MDTRTSVFISYSRKDVAFAVQLAATLNEAGFAPKLDTKDIVAGEPWRDRLAGLIEASDEIVFLISPDSVTSEICEWEIAHAERLGKRILPVVCRATEMAAIPLRLHRLQFTFLTPCSDTAAEFDKLLSALREDTSWVRRHTALVARAQHWDAAGRADHAILRGKDLSDAEDLVLRRPPKPATPEIPQVVKELITSSRATERQERDRLRRTLGLAYIEPVQTAFRDGEFETAIKLAAWGALQADDLSFGLVPELWDAVAPAIVSLPIRARLHGHSRRIKRSAVDPGHRLLATGDQDGKVILWDLETKRARCSISHRDSSPISVVTALALSPDTELAASASAAGDLVVWRATDASLVHSFPALWGVVTDLAWSPDGSHLAVGLGLGQATVNGNDELASVGDGRAKLLILDPIRGSVLHVSVELPAPISVLSFAPCSTRIAVGLWCGPTEKPGAARVYGLNPFKELLQLDVYGHNLKQVIFSPDGRYIVTNSERGDYSQSEIANIIDKQPTRTPKWMGTSEVTRSFDAKRSWVQSWDAHSGKKRVEYIGHINVVHHVSFNSDGRSLVTAASDGATRIWDAETGNEVQRLFQREQCVYRAAFSRDGRRIATKSDDDAVRVWNARNGELLREYIDHHADRSWWGRPDKVTTAQCLFFYEEDRGLCDISGSQTPVCMIPPNLRSSQSTGATTVP